MPPPLIGYLPKVRAGWVTVRLEVDHMRTQIVEHLSEYVADLQATVAAEVEAAVKAFRPEADIFQAATAALRDAVRSHVQQCVRQRFADDHLFKKDIDRVVERMLNERSRLAQDVHYVLMAAERVVDPKRPRKERQGDVEYLRQLLVQLQQDHPA
jgi:1,6-anhydro-N-acetylmuramate kinase